MVSELAKLIDSGESGTIEFKKSFGREAIETITAFANSEGGFVCIGVNNQGELKGVAATDEVIKDWLNQLKMATVPSLFPRYKIFDQEGRIAVVFVVEEYPLKPVACKGRYFKRHGASNHLLTSDEIVELKLHSLNVSFDSFIVVGNFDSLNQRAVGNFARDIEKSGRYKSSGEISNDLENLVLQMMDSSRGLLSFCSVIIGLLFIWVGLKPVIQ
jgi:ATP-dependent DNA helicase RecG